MRVVGTFLVCFLFAGCVSESLVQSDVSEDAPQVEQAVRGMTPLMNAIKDGNAERYQKLVNAEKNINATDENGRSALHYAVRFHDDEALMGLILNKGAEPNKYDKNGKSPLSYAIKYRRPESAALLLASGARKEDLGTMKYQVEALYKEKLASREIALREQKEKQESEKVKVLKSRQKCGLKEDTWFYLGNQCSGGLAHGQGEAMHQNGQLKFVGQFEHGVRVKGILSSDGMALYDGPVVDGKPHGVGVCYHEKEPEECKYYHGKRIDTLYKQRIELARQREEMAKMQAQMTARMSDLERKQMQAASAQGGGKGFGDALMEEGQRRIASKIFDSLF